VFKNYIFGTLYKTHIFSSIAKGTNSKQNINIPYLSRVVKYSFYFCVFGHTKSCLVNLFLASIKLKRYTIWFLKPKNGFQKDFMPIFEYKCSDCGKISEFLEKADSKAPHTCPGCSSNNLTKQFSTFSAIVKQSAAASKCHTCPSGKNCPHSGL
jgi:putative FmdB family regulatory protein